MTDTNKDIFGSIDKMETPDLLVLLEEVVRSLKEREEQEPHDEDDVVSLEDISDTSDDSDSDEKPSAFPFEGLGRHMPPPPPPPASNFEMPNVSFWFTRPPTGYPPANVYPPPPFPPPRGFGFRGGFHGGRGGFCRRGGRGGYGRWGYGRCGERHHRGEFAGFPPRGYGDYFDYGGRYGHHHGHHHGRGCRRGREQKNQEKHTEKSQE
ncbi:DEKNAAC101129 [Brettanomyces naardenensis]|uniref:DEKNAAC101129 n=1 Tax=Brettanomyces naardenensis TaxID=13370 RepID=A0A448YHN5_BRENA|nr:DEKNAAC101129 [Brettanomyces naardenensis]